MSGSNKPSFDLSGIKDRQIKNVLQKIVNFIEIGEGRRSNISERWLKRSDFKDRGTIKDLASQLIDYNNDLGGGIFEEKKDLTPPPTPTGFAGFSGIDCNYLTWDHIYDARIGFAEIYRHTEDNRGLATAIGFANAAIYNDVDVEPGVPYFYWIRYVNKWSDPDAPIYSDYNDTAGTEVVPAEDPTKVLAALTDQITESQLFQGLKEQQTLKTSEVGGTTYIAGVGAFSTDVDYDGNVHREVGFLVDTFWIGSPGDDSFQLIVEDGRVVMDGALIANATIGYAAIGTAAINTLVANSISAMKLEADWADIWTLVIGDEIRSDNYVPGTSGFLIAADGTFELYGGTVRSILQSANYDGVSNGWRLDPAGNAFITGTVIASALKANQADIVDTIHLTGNSVMLAEYLESATYPGDTGGITAVLLSKTLDLSSIAAGQPVILSVSLTGKGRYGGTGGGDFASTTASEPTINIYRDGALIRTLPGLSMAVWPDDSSDFDEGNFRASGSASVADFPSPGPHTYDLRVAGKFGGTDYFSTMTIMVGKR